MYLSRLELFGFKSFPYHLELELGMGLTAIVGPNGCGKTNLLDAIRWAMGEQSAKTLRSETMEDVIFSGTKDQKPLSLAEATLIFNNEDRALAVDYSEVEITRRIFRSGESEYYLNKQLCRLKDVTDLLLNTGLGADSYAVIELRMIDAVLSEDPGERRLLFEEAAGVAKYRRKRRETLRKLEATEADLLRLTDIASEVEKRVRSLKRQVRQAEAYQELRARLIEKEKLLGSRTLFALDREEKVLKEEGGRLSSAREEQARALTRKETETEELRLKIQANQDGLTRVQEKLDGVSDQLRTIEQEAAGARERREGLERGIADRERDIRDLLERIGTAEARVKEGRTEVEAKVRDIHALELSLSAKEENLARAQDEHQKQRVAVGAIQQRIFERVREESEERNQLSLFTVRLEGISQRAGRLIQERSAEEEALKKLAQETAQAEAEREEARGAAERLKEEEGALREARLKAEEEAKRLAQKAGDLSQALELKRAELSLLEGLVAGREGYSDGVRTLLAEVPGMATVADAIEAEPPYIRAIEAALGEKLEWVLLERSEQVKTAIALLRSKRQGQVTLVPLDRVGAKEKGKGRKPEGSDGFARDFVKVRETRFAGAVEQLLKDVVVVRDYDTALLLLGRRENSGFSFVTLDGEMVQHSGIVTYLGEGGEKAGHLERKRRIEDLRHELAVGDFDLKEARRSQERGEAVAYQAVSSLQDCVSRQEKESLRVREAEARIERAGFQSGRARERREALDAEAKGLSEEQNTLALSFREAETSFAVAVEEKEREEHFLVEEEARLLAQETKRQDLAREANEMKVRLAEERGEREKLLAEMEALSRMKALAMEEITRKRGEQGASESKILTLQEVVAREESEMAALQESRQALLRDRGRVEVESRGLLEALKQAEGALHALIKEGDQVSEKAYEGNLRLSRIGMERQSLQERLKEEYDLAVELLESDEPPAPLDALKAETEELRINLKRFGAVNLVALEEFQEEEKRFTFLTVQKDDMEKARTDLRASITKIDETARTLFVETFAKIQEGFHKVFSTLFSGGEAELALVGEGDPLEAEIDILANPEGKRLRSISLLSGGERTLTAISLLFGIYLVKPAPFCVLDEVDAPLDDANIGRFVKLMNEFKQNTQFAIITHNKKTMEAADRLYGVTMEEPGVSKVVSVRFDRAKVMAGVELLPGSSRAEDVKQKDR